MDALNRGAADLIGSFVKAAARSGLAVLILLGCVGGLTWFALRIDAQRRQDKAEFKAELAEARNEYRSELAACNAAREKLADTVKDLTVQVAILKRKR